MKVVGAIERCLLQFGERDVGGHEIARGTLEQTRKRGAARRRRRRQDKLARAQPGARIDVGRRHQVRHPLDALVEPASCFDW